MLRNLFAPRRSRFGFGSRRAMTTRRRSGIALTLASFLAPLLIRKLRARRAQRSAGAY